jgi:Matrixin
MGEVEIKQYSIIIHSVIFFYGGAANDELSFEIAKDIADHWNEPGAIINMKGRDYQVHFDIKGVWAGSLTPEMVFENTDPRNNYFRIEEFAGGNISFVDGLGSNTGYFKLDNLLNHSTTAAHEYGHTLGLDHPEILDIRGSGVPGIMYPRGTIVDPGFQYSPVARPLEPGGTMNPFTRKVLQKDIEALRINRLRFNNKGFVVLGEFSSVWHEAHVF